MSKIRIVGMEGQGDERLEPSGFVLQLAQPDQVVDPVRGALDVAVEHGGVGVQAQSVSGAVNVKPGLRRRLGAADLLTHFGMKDLGPAARETAQPGVDELPE